MLSVSFRTMVVGLACGTTLGGLTVLASAQQAPEGAAGHRVHRTPDRWKFTWPKGDPAKGRQVFVKLECYSCHEVKGERFPVPSEAGKVGPELAAMGPLHELEYFAEAVINPNAVVEKGKSYEGPDGSSKMPSYNDAVTVQEVVDLAAYLRALRPPGEPPAEHGGHGGEPEQGTRTKGSKP